MAHRPKKVFILGLDSVIPKFARQFMAEGRMPNLKKIYEQGSFTDALPNYPPWTPPGWASVATGAHPSTSGVEGFGVHYEGEPLTKEHDGFFSGVRRAEAIWEAAGKAGKKCIVFKYPGSWPHRPSENTTQILGLAGYAGRKSPLDIHHSVCWGTRMEGTIKGNTITTNPAQDWRGDVPTGALAATLTVDVENGEPEQYCVLLHQAPQGPRATLCRSKDLATSVGTLAVGQWTDWVYDTYVREGQKLQGAFKAKLLRLSDDLSDFRILFGPNHPHSGWTTPAGLESEYIQQAGPIWEYSESYYELFWGWAGHDTVVEMWDEHIDWMCKSVEYFGATREWDLFITQSHLIDNVQHCYFGAIDPGHPQYNPEVADKYWEIIKHGYELVDRLIGTAMKVVGPDGLVAVTGDHGHSPRRWSFSVNTWLQQQGWLTTYKDELGHPKIDWKRTKAYAMGPVHIFLNVQGRDPDGVVEPGREYEELRDQIIEAMYGVKHGEKFIIQFAFKREEMDAFGLYGGGVGDILYMVREGYDCGASMRAQSLGENYGINEDGTLVVQTQLFKEISSQHCSVVPWTILNRTWSAFYGPGVKKGHVRKVPSRLVDVTPTVCYLAGIPYPAQAEGSPLIDAIEHD